MKSRLRQGALDLVLAATPDALALDLDLEWLPMMTDEYCVMAARSHPLRGRRAIELGALRRSAGIITRRGMEPNPAAVAPIESLIRTAKTSDMMRADAPPSVKRDRKSVAPRVVRE